MQTFLQLKQKLRAQIWPGGESVRLRSAHDGHFKSAMLDLQKWIDCLRQHNVTQYQFPDTFWHDGKTCVTAPFGEVRRVYTVANEATDADAFRDRVDYRSSTWDEMECWAKRLFESTSPTIIAGQELTLGYRHAGASSDSAWGRARIGIWTIYRKRLYVAPWLQSNETLIVDWDGEKNDWLDTDGVDQTYWTMDVEEAITYYVTFKHELFYGDKVLAADFRKLYDEKLSDLIWKCREYTRKKQDHICDAGADGDMTGLTTARTDDDAVPDTTNEDTVLFDAVGDVGDQGANAAAVAAAVISDHPEVFLALGDLSYNGSYELDFGDNYQKFIDAKTLVPVVGNHDLSSFGNSLATFKSYFADFIRSDGGVNYEYVIGPCHFFVYNSEDTDGIDSTSAQAEWLMAKVLLSTAKWKIVLMHKPPFSSDTTHGSTAALQLDYVEWGADLVLSAHAHDYERLNVDGLPYIVVGTGGHNLYSFGTPVAGSVIRYNSKYGRLVGRADCTTLTVSFKTVDGAVIDTLTLTKA